jgi:hypothetical protein
LRATSIVEAVLALALGAGGGAGFIMGTGDLKSGAQIEQLEREKTEVEHKIDEHRKELTQREALVAEKAKADLDRARQEQEQKAKAEQEQQAKALKEKEALSHVEKLPPFGLLTIKALSGDLDIDGGPGLKGTGKTVDLAFQEAPGKIKVRTGKFTVVLTPKVSAAKTIFLDVQVSPLAIITADGNRVGTSAPGLLVERKPFKLDFASPAAGDMNLLLTFKK